MAGEQGDRMNHGVEREMEKMGLPSITSTTLFVSFYLAAVSLAARCTKCSATGISEGTTVTPKLDSSRLAAAISNTGSSPLPVSWASPADGGELAAP